MADNNRKCSGCHNILPKYQFLACGKCDMVYDLLCTNVSEKRFYLMTAENKKNWKCELCMSKKRRVNNAETPVRNSLFEECIDVKSPKDMNVTHRKKQSALLPDSDESLIDEQIINDESILGDTLKSPAITATSPVTTPGVITIDHISELLDKKLSIYENKILSVIKTELRPLIHDEIQNVMSNFNKEMTHRLNNISAEQIRYKSELDCLNTKICSLEKDYAQLMEEVKHINKQYNIGQTDLPKIDNSRKLVLHGLSENEWENDNELYDRVMQVFSDILGLNLDGYIEGLTRLGKKGQRRPIVVELINKRIPQIALQNKYYFKGTGLAVSEFLDREAILERRRLGKLLQEARNAGHHAVIRNNKLMINGKEHIDNTKTEELQTPTAKEIHSTQTATKINNNTAHKQNHTFRN